MVGLGLGSHGFTGLWGVALSVPTQEEKSPSLHVLVLPVLLYGCETWTLIRDLRRRLNSFGSRSLQRTIGYR